MGMHPSVSLLEQPIPTSLITSVLNNQPRAQGWREPLTQIIQQEPLIKTHLSQKGLQRLPEGAPPSCVFIGLGLGTSMRLGEALPLDLLGVLLPAERVRRAICAPTLAVMIADNHAYSNGFGQLQVQRSVRRLARSLVRIKAAFGLKELEIIKASDFHSTSEYQRILAQVEARAPARTHPYFKLEVADICYMERTQGGLIKVGWTIRTSPGASTTNDELAFDRKFLRWTGLKSGFIYCSAGRTLDDLHPKVSPYICLDKERRICLDPGESIREKVARSMVHLSESTRRGVKNHLRKIGRCYCEVVEPVSGTWSQRTQTIIERLFN